MENTPSSGNPPERFNPEEMPFEQLVEQAVAAVAQGENPEQILEAMQIILPADMREKARKAFSALLAKRNLRQPSGEADIPSRATLARIRNALAISARQMMDRILQLTRVRPDVAASIKQAGQILVKNGVRADRVVITETDLGTMAPSVVPSQQGTDRGTGRS